MFKTSAVVVTWIIAVIAWFGIFFPPKISGTAIKASPTHVETLCYSNCPGKFNGHRQLEHE